ncbi:hypothetical protein P7H60_03520 [Vagococcus carniphilus]|uniref:hypothetical protein n=1 Tax=Vagococcus carniphilus TaxID=218144 RepID=UPI0028907A5A|nr:hypothetical protein [Vagococcus carniphilus]MDT2848241.1 hypothetical protein [Vagococcus carniphilus]
MNDKLTYETLLKNKNDLELDFLKQTDGELWIRLYQVEVKGMKVNKDLPQIELYFEDYICIHIDDECYVEYTPGFKGHLFRTYKKSTMLDYVKDETITIPYLKASHNLSNSDKLKLTHYKICTMNSIISVVTENEPKVKLVI